MKVFSGSPSKKKIILVVAVMWWGSILIDIQVYYHLIGATFSPPENFGSQYLSQGSE